MFSVEIAMTMADLYQEEPHLKAQVQTSPLQHVVSEFGTPQADDLCAVSSSPTGDDASQEERRPRDMRITVSFKGSKLGHEEYLKQQKVDAHSSSGHVAPSSSLAFNGSLSSSSPFVSLPPPSDSPASEQSGSASNRAEDTPSYLPPPPSDTPEFPSLPSTPHGTGDFSHGHSMVHDEQPMKRPRIA